jgi:hypothetical protein
MGMIESGKKLKELEEKLYSGNKKVISDTIISLRNADPVKGAIGLLIYHFETSDDPEIKRLVIDFLNDLKEPGARIEVVAEIKKDFKPDTICMLVSSCWQSGLDYSGYAIDFADLFIKADYRTALECFTVLEESVTGISVPVKKEINKRLESGKKSFSAEKVVLADALIVVLC